jgi:N-acetyl-anhydromuramyl-L-alanine amidase AmpD
MSNSSLINYTKLSPYKNSPRSHTIDTITIHCYVGQVSVEDAGDWFANSGSSCNYVIGKDGRIGLIVNEEDRSWCSSSRDNDHRAITIECASDKTPPYAVNDKVFESLIKLCADICKRNNIKELKWQGNKSLVGQVDKQNMTVHRWFANKECPGEYLYNKHGEIAERVNNILNPPAPISNEVIYKVQVGAYKVKLNATLQLNNMKKKGVDGFVTKVGDYYKVQVGAYSVKANAENMLKRLKELGFDGFVVSTNTAQTEFIAELKKALGLKASATTSQVLAKTPKLFNNNTYNKVTLVLQKYLNAIGFDCGKIDGYFGNGTEKAVKAYQTKYTGTADGIMSAKGKMWKHLLGL